MRGFPCCCVKSTLIVVVAGEIMHATYWSCWRYTRSLTSSVCFPVGQAKYLSCFGLLFPPKLIDVGVERLCDEMGGMTSVPLRRGCVQSACNWSMPEESEDSSLEVCLRLINDGLI